MKKIMGIIITLIAVHSFAGEIPEAKSLHPELYTIQITCLNFHGLDIFKNEDLLSEKQLEQLKEINDEERLQIEEYENLLEDIVDEEEIEEAKSLFRRRAQKLYIKRAEVLLKQGYTDTETIYTRPGEPFSGKYDIKGILDVESNTINYIYQNEGPGNPTFYFNEWVILVESGNGLNASYLLAKCYPPTNVPSDEEE